jgi:hypothetical protein
MPTAPVVSPRSARLDAVVAEYLDIAAASRYLSLSPRSIRTHAHSPTDPIRSYRIGALGKLLFRRGDLDLWVASHAVPVGGGVEERIARRQAQRRRARRAERKRGGAR